MYYIDTPTGQVDRFDYDHDTGQIGNRTVAVRVPSEMGFPDGMTIDSEGMLVGLPVAGRQGVALGSDQGRTAADGRPARFQRHLVRLWRGKPGPALYHHGADRQSTRKSSPSSRWPAGSFARMSA